MVVSVSIHFMPDFSFIVLYLSPPYFNRISRKARNLQAVPVLGGLSLIIYLLEITLFYFLIR